MNILKSVTAVLAGVALFVATGSTSSASLFNRKSAVVVTELTDANAAMEIANSKIPVVIDFYATWCGPCQRLAPHIEDAARIYKGKVKVVRCDVDQNPALVAKYGVNRFPTIVTIKPGATPVSHIGYRTLRELKDLIDALLVP